MSFSQYMITGLYPYSHVYFFNIRLLLLRYFSNDFFCSGFSTNIFLRIYLSTPCYITIPCLSAYVQRKFVMSSGLRIFIRLFYKQEVVLYEYFLSHGNQIGIRLSKKPPTYFHNFNILSRVSVNKFSCDKN
jgi:hypothetical protein